MNSQHNGQNEPDLSIIVLGYQAGEELEGFIDEVHSVFKNTGVDYECIVVANYWPNKGDLTPGVAKRCAEKNARVKVVAKEKQGMMGWDMRSGLEMASGNILGIIDGDNQFPPESLILLYDEMVKQKVDVCKTIRVSRADGLYRKLISTVYNFIFRLLFPSGNFRDVNSKPKFIKREVYKKMDLASDGWFIDAEIMIQVRRYNCSLLEFPIDFRKNTRASFVKPIAILEFIYELMRFRLKEFRHGK